MTLNTIPRTETLTIYRYDAMTKAGSKRKKSTATAEADPEAPATEETPENLDKVRDILFGGHMRAVDQRLASLEKRFQRDIAALHADTDKRLEALEGHIKKEIESLTSKLRSERTKRADDLKALNSEMQEGFKSLEKRLEALDETSSTADADLRTAIHEQGKTVSEDLKKLSERFSADLQQAVAELRGDKLDTASLIQLFSDMALNLSEDLQTDSESE